MVLSGHVVRLATLQAVWRIWRWRGCDPLSGGVCWRVGLQRIRAGRGLWNRWSAHWNSDYSGSGTGCSSSKIGRRRSWRRNQSLLYREGQILNHHRSRGESLSTLDIVLWVVVRLKHVQSTEAYSFISLLDWVPLIVPEFEDLTSKNSRKRNANFYKR